MGFYPVAVVYNNTQQTNNTHHTKITTIKGNTAHKTAHTIKNTLLLLLYRDTRISENLLTEAHGLTRIYCTEAHG
jgi:hypothetical protein